MSSAEKKAVFLSYASQDAEAARRICETLRSGGVEVWFDADGGLEHGDEWDAKIRRQIKECVLFIPVISANTQAREEGYFRLEWDLAAERARTIASGVPFILPVVIDDTREPDALVPDRFRNVQWTKLRGGEVTPEVKARYLKLWSHRTGLLKSRFSAGPSPEAQSPALASPPSKKARWPLVLGIGAAVVAISVGGFLAMRRSTPPVASPTVRKSPPPPPPSVPSKRYASSRPDVAALLTRVQAMTDKTDVARAELETALSLLEQAAKLDSADPSVWAERALVEFRYLTSHLDDSPARIDAARQHAKQATSLDPKNPTARLADALTQMQAATNPASRNAAAAILESLVAENTDRADAYFFLANLKFRNRQADEAFALFDQAAHLPGAAGRAAYKKAVSYTARADWGKASEVLDQALVLERSTSALLWKSYLAAVWLGDAALAKQAIADIPPDMLTEDFPASGKLFVALWVHDFATVIATMRAIPRNYIGSGALSGPTGYYIGYGLARDGRKSAAEIEWRSALEVVNKRFEGDPRNPTLFAMKALLLAALGDRGGAEKNLQTLRELYPTAWANSWEGHMLAMELLPPEEAIAELAKNGLAGIASGLAGSLKLDPFVDHLRSHPKFAELLAKAESNPKLNPAAARSAPGAAVPENRPMAGANASAPDNPSAPAEKSVAVLAFANLSDDKANEYFSDGISEELLTVLQKIPGLHVAARTSAFSFKGKSVTAQEIGTALNVAHLVEGSVQKAGNRVKISARLSRAATGEQLWSDNFTRDLADVFAVQTEIAQIIVAQLRGQLTGETAAAAKTQIQAQVLAATKGGTKNPAAYQFYLQGRFLALRANPADVARGIDYYEKAVAADPSFAVAWAALARARLWQGSWEAVFLERFRQAQAAAEQALALEPELGDAHSAISQVMQRHFFDWRRAREEAARAVTLAPADSGVLTDAAWCALTLGDLARSIDFGQRAAALDPVNADARLFLAVSYFFADRLPEARTEIRRLLELAPNANFAHLVACMLLVIDGHPEDALAEAKLEPERMHQLEALALAEFARGRRSESDVALAALKKDFADNCPYQIAEVYAYRNEPDGAFEWLEHAWQVRDPGVSWIKVATLLRNLHKDPRWPELLKKIGLSDEQLK